MEILVIDPEAEIRLVFFVASAQVDCEVYFAVSGEDAISQLSEETKFDLIFCSAELDDIPPTALASRIREFDHYKFCPLVFFSTNDDSDYLVSLLEYGDDVILKPFSQQVLFAKILAYKRIQSLYQALESQNQQLIKFQKRTETELLIASDIFKQFTKRSLPKVEGITSFVSPYSVFNGDLQLFAKGPQQQLYFLVADVTGHGLSAALGTLPIAETFLDQTAKGDSVGKIARKMNHLFQARMPPYILCAAIVGVFNSQAQSVRFWSGGMPAMLVVDNTCKIKNKIHASQMAIGACDDAVFDDQEEIINLDTNDQLLCYTDGIIETANPDGEMFGMQRLIDSIESCQDNNLVGYIINQLETHVGSNNFSDDDVTLVCLDVDICRKELMKGEEWVNHL